MKIFLCFGVLFIRSNSFLLFLHLGDGWQALSEPYPLSTHFMEISLALTMPSEIFCKTARKLNSSGIKKPRRVKFSRIARGPRARIPHWHLPAFGIGNRCPARSSKTAALLGFLTLAASAGIRWGPKPFPLCTHFDDGHGHGCECETVGTCRISEQWASVDRAVTEF